MAGNTSWRMDDLDGGLSTDLFNLSGLGNELSTNPGAYNMSDVLNLPIFKDNSSVFEELHGATITAENGVRQPIAENPCQQVKKESSPMLSCNHTAVSSDTELSNFCFILKAPTAPGKKVNEDTLTYLNQGQSYPIDVQYIGSISLFKGSLLTSVVTLTFYERKLQVVEAEKFEEWRNNHPLERIFEIDVPMSTGLQNIRSKGNLTNAYEFDWNPEEDQIKLYIIINCVSSEFTKGKSGGESGVPLQIQIETWSIDASFDELPMSCNFCQVKVFKSKGADRKHKMELQKLESKSHDEIGQLQMSNDFTLLKEQPLEKKEKPLWTSPNPISPRGVTADSPAVAAAAASPSILSSPSAINQSASTPSPHELTSESSIEETRVWLQANRFHNYVSMFANYTGADLLRLTRQDVIQILGPADGIRLHNALQSRAARPLLTLYVSLESTQQVSGMKEYHAMFLEALTLHHLRKKLANKCSITEDQIVAVYRWFETLWMKHILSCNSIERRKQVYIA
ncbi:transcription factor CP2 isoform X2 [Nematostella vectensis]|uniref:transcription factor CP2 isoform X2 n=1 Tax=Nematostella vectensis TaxID=45351 RepID=UPI0013901941|nr:transcription factor CP2 isoform X2 [Nematostella vectensis]